MRRRSVVVVVMMVLAACGSSDPASTSPKGERLVDALMTSYRTGRAKQAFTPGEARCIAEHAIDAAGIDALERANIAPSDLDHGSAFQTLAEKLPADVVDEVATAIAGSGCVDIGEVLLRSGASADSAFAKVSKAKVRCLFVRLGAPRAAHRAFADSLLGLPRGDREFVASFRDRTAVLRALGECHIRAGQISG